MKFIPAKCPSCSGDLQIPDDRDFVKCMYCGGDIKVREVICIKENKEDKINDLLTQYLVYSSKLNVRGLFKKEYLDSVLRCLEICLNIIRLNPLEFTYYCNMVSNILLYLALSEEVPIFNIKDDNLYFNSLNNIKKITQYKTKTKVDDIFIPNDKLNNYLELIFKTYEILYNLDDSKGNNKYFESINKIILDYINNNLLTYKNVFFVKENGISIFGIVLISEKDKTFKEETDNLNALVGLFAGLLYICDKLYQISHDINVKTKIQEISKLSLKGGYYLRQRKTFFNTYYDTIIVKKSSLILKYVNDFLLRVN